MLQPNEMLAAGTKNQTALVVKLVSGRLFGFAPAADEFLKTHLFGDISVATSWTGKAASWPPQGCWPPCPAPGRS
ncbi:MULTISPECIES: hypothetical protein [unclassified Pantoea]|uniref:hypothetical protein n=1 Tax=unclassified Pantoea TaxID=2630326 RepID=UPI002552879E|nr:MULTISPECIES: hypothetical protein [unclassified Pantoea]